jgi:acyl-CoA thioester hydrolase
VPFSVDITVRGYELDVQGHLNQAVYLQYAEHVRWEALLAAGLSQDTLRKNGIGPALLSQTVTYVRELRGGDRAQVTCAFEYGSGKTFKAVHRIVKQDGTAAADVVGTVGLLDLSARRLLPDPAERLRTLADRPEVLDL